MRVGAVVAIAARDLRSELKGRAGLGLPVISLLLLLPIALVGRAPDAFQRLPVRGDIPPVVAELPGVEVGNRGTGFRTVDGVVMAFDYRIPDAIRDALDGDDPVVEVRQLHPPTRVPGRTLLLALVTASTLTGSVATSIGGERARHTLQALLSAAVTRLEIVTGKWLAWTAFGTAGALIASVAAILSGRTAAGSWLLAMPVVPALTVALGLWLVRRTEDVVAGTSVSLRVMPAVLGVSGLMAWILSSVTDVGAALIPLGGALMVAGDLWQGEAVPTALALSTSGLTTGLLLVLTARDLEERPAARSSRGVNPWAAVPDALLIGGLWASMVPGPVLWGWAGNPDMTALLTADRGLIAGAAMLGVMALVRAVREASPDGLPTVGRPTWEAVVAGLALYVAWWVPAWTFDNPWMAEASTRMTLGLYPTGGAVLLVVLAQEVWFRGWLQRRAGWWASALAWTVAIAPLNPLAGVLSGLILGWVARKGLADAVLARFLAVVLVWMTIG